MAPSQSVRIIGVRIIEVRIIEVGLYIRLTPRCLFNSRSIVKKLSNFQSFAYSSSHKISAISETWVSDYIYGHKWYHRKDRCSCGGGVLVALDSSIPSIDLELMAVKITYAFPDISVYSQSSVVFDSLIYVLYNSGRMFHCSVSMSRGSAPSGSETV